MKNLLLIISLLFTNIIVAQISTVVANQEEAFRGMSTAVTNRYGASARFINPPKEVMGSIYLFDNWNNVGIMYTKSNKKFIVNNINLNMEKNVFQARFSKDTIFTYYFNNIDKIVVNNKVYKSLFSEEGKRLYEIIYESDDFSILKGFDIQYVTGSVNPMLRRLNDKYVRVQTYYIKKKDDVIKPFRFNKKKVLKLLADNPARIEKINEFIEENKLSFKKDEDVKKALVYSEVN